MSTDFLELVARLAWTASWAVAAVLLVRRALRRWFGAALAYQAWVIVPVALLATALPFHSPVRQVVATPALDLATYASPALAQAGVAWSSWLLLAWTAGALAVGTGFWRAHVAFLRSLGKLTLHEGVYFSELGGGPASFGLLRPRIVVPANFAQRYSSCEQGLILAHERVHIRRGDAVANQQPSGLASMRTLVQSNRARGGKPFPLRPGTGVRCGRAPSAAAATPHVRRRHAENPVPFRRNTRRNFLPLAFPPSFEGAHLEPASNPARTCPPRYRPHPGCSPRVCGRLQLPGGARRHRGRPERAGL